MDLTLTLSVFLVILTGGHIVTGIEKRWREAHGCNGQSISLGCESASSIRPMCSQFEATVTEGFLSTTKYPTWAPKTDRNCNCWLQPIGGHVTVQVVNYYYSPGPGESENGFNLTARWGSGWPIRIKGVSDSRYVNYTLANRTTERVHLQLLNEGISVGILWLHFIGTGSVRVTCQSSLPPSTTATITPPTTTTTTTRSTLPIRPQTFTPPTISLSSAPTYRTTATSNHIQTQNATAYPSDGSDGAAFKRYIIGGVVGGSTVLVLMLIILIITVLVLQSRWKGKNAKKDEIHLDNIATQDTQSVAAPRSMASGPSTVPDGIYEDIQESAPRPQLPQAGTSTGEWRAEHVEYYVDVDNLRPQAANDGAYSNLSQTNIREGENTYTGLQHIS